MPRRMIYGILISCNGRVWVIIFFLMMFYDFELKIQHFVFLLIILCHFMR